MEPYLEKLISYVQLKIPDYSDIDIRKIFSSESRRLQLALRLNSSATDLTQKVYAAEIALCQELPSWQRRMIIQLAQENPTTLSFFVALGFGRQELELYESTKLAEIPKSQRTGTKKIQKLAVRKKQISESSAQYTMENGARNLPQPKHHQIKSEAPYAFLFNYLDTEARKRGYGGIIPIMRKYFIRDPAYLQRIQSGDYFPRNHLETIADLLKIPVNKLEQMANEAEKKSRALEKVNRDEK